jgi:hypothetical protein
MAGSGQRNLVTRLADAGEEAIQKLGDAPGADRLLGAMNAMRDRVDELQKKVRGFDDVEKRLSAIERRLDKLEGKTPASSRKRTASTSRKSGTSSSG